MASPKKHLMLSLLWLGLTTIASAAPPNVLLITVDDMNCDSVGTFGCQVAGITPNIDRLAAQGMRFEQAHVTIAICQPTRAVWMTGRYPHRNGALGFDPIDEGVPTLLETLDAAGYYTGIFAKVKHVVPSRKSSWDVIVPANELREGRSPQRYYQSATRFFKAAKSRQEPFFLMANSQDPHRPFAGSRQEEGRKKQLIDFPPVRRKYQPDEVTIPGFLPDLPAVRQEMAEYYTSVHRADEIVGSVLQALSESGLEDKTLVMFLSDHGMPLPFAKTNCWYHSTRTPWIVRWPGTIAPNQVDHQHLISGIDLTPTVLEAVGLPPLDESDGRSFFSILRGEVQHNREFAITHINRTAGKKEYPMRSVIDRRFGYIFNGWADGETRFRNESQSGRTMDAMRNAAKSDPALAARVQHFLFRVPEELYDYQQDPDALHNLADDPRYQSILVDRRARLLTHMEQTGDPQLDRFRDHIKKSQNDGSRD